MKEAIKKYIGAAFLSLVSFGSGLAIGADMALKKILNIAYQYAAYQNITIDLTEATLRDFASKILNLI